MDDRHAVRETRRHALHGLRGESDFRHQHDAAFAPGDNRGQRLQIDLGLAAAGHAMQQNRGGGRRDGGRQDGGWRDGGRQDGGRQDGGWRDGGGRDRGWRDGGWRDGGWRDGGWRDGGRQDG